MFESSSYFPGPESALVQKQKTHRSSIIIFRCEWINSRLLQTSLLTGV